MIKPRKGENLMRPFALLGLVLVLTVPAKAQADRLDKLVGDLSLGNPSSKVAAIEELSKMGGPRAEEHLIKTLADEDPKVRLRATEALGRMKSRRAVDGLSSRVRFDGDSTVRRQAIRSLQAIGDSKAVPGLIRALSDPDPFVVSLAAKALGRLGDHAASGPLMDSYELAPHSFVAAEIAIALAKLPEGRLKEFYLARLTDSSADVRLAAIKALVNIGASDAYEHLMFLAERDNDPSVRKEAKKAAKKLAP
jgi:HEAT repeat protein